MKSITFSAIGPNAYGALVTCGIIIAGLVAFFSLRKRGQNPEMVLDMVLLGVPLAVIGARIFYMTFDSAGEPFFWEWFKIWDGGLSILGGVIGALIAALIFAFVIFRRRKEPYNKLSLMQILDVAFMCFLVGQAIGRWGNFFNTEVYGKPVEGSGILSHFPFSVDVNGTQHHALFFYESILNLFAFGVLVYLYNFSKRKSFDGFFFGAYCIWYGTVRAIMEPMRDEEFILGGAAMVSRIVSILLITLGVAIFVWHIVTALRNKQKIFILVPEEQLCESYYGAEKSIFLVRKEWGWTPGMKFIKGVPQGYSETGRNSRQPAKPQEDTAAVKDDKPQKKERKEVKDFDDEI